MNIENVGRNIDTIRKARGWSKDTLAEKLGVHSPSVYKHIKFGNMSLAAILKYAEVLGCTFADLTADTVNPEAFHLDTDLEAYYPFNLAMAVVSDPWNKSEEEREQNRLMMHRVYAPELLLAVQELTEREQKILQLRFYNGMTYDQVGGQLGVSRERIRQIEHKAIRKLRHPRYRKHWLLDTLDKAADFAAERDRLKLENIQLREKLSKYTENDIKEEPKEDVPGITLEEMDLSVRSYNCLRRRGITHLLDLCDMTEKDLMRVRNLGKRSFDEIIEKMHEYGVDLKHD